MARALAAGRADRDPDVALGGVLAATLPSLGADFGFAIDLKGDIIASVSTTASGLAFAAREYQSLLAAGRAALDGDLDNVGGDLTAVPLEADGKAYGALVLRAIGLKGRPDFAASAQLTANCLAELLKTSSPRPSDGRQSNVSQRLVKSLAAHPDGVALFGRDGGLVTANQAFALAHGASSSELKGLTLEEILRRNHDGFGPLLLARDIRGDDAKGDAPEMALAADGRWLRLSRRRTASGDELVIQSAADDAIAGIAEARRRLLAAKTDAKAQKDAWQNLAVGAIVLSPAGRIVELNNEACRLLGAGKEHLLGKRLGRIGATPRADWTPIGRAKTGVGELAAKARRLPDGRSLLTLAELPSAAAPGTKLDDEQTTRALAATQALGELGHEMRTPLNAVIGFSDVLLARSFGPLNDRQAQYLQDIGDAGKHMLEMVDNMLDHAQLTSGRYPFDPEWTDISKVAEDALKFVGPAADAGRISLTLEPFPIVEAFIDRRGILQVLINLLTNAVKFTPAGGAVSIAADKGGGGAFRVMVIDDGEGIPEDDLIRVMEPFSQARRLGGRPLKGAGLGLSIVRAITLMHDGDVDIASKLGEGTTVSIELPAERIRMAAD